MKFDPAEPWERKLARLAKIFAARRARLLPSASVRQAIVEVEARGRTPLAELLDRPLGPHTEETQAQRLLAKAVRPDWWAADLRAIREAGHFDSNGEGAAGP